MFKHLSSSWLVLLALFAATIASASSQLPYTQGFRYKRDGNSAVCSMTRSCANVGQACGSVQTNSIVMTGCNGYSVCNITSTGLQSTGVCVAVPKARESCEGHNECIDGHVCDAVTKTCVEDAVEATSGPGASCTSDKQCLLLQPDGTATHNCDAGRCRFVPDMGTCTYSGAQCNTLTSFCNSSDNLCHPRLSMGAACDMRLPESGCAGSCIPPFRNSTSGTCKELYSARENQLCSFDADCYEGLFCSPAQTSSKYGTCQRVKNTATLHKPCTSDESCDTFNNEYCSCNTMYSETPVCTVDVLPSGYVAATNAYEKCANAKCALANGDYNRTCLAAQCLSELCNFVKISATASDDFASDCFMKNTLLPICASLPTTTPTTSTLAPDFAFQRSSLAIPLAVSLPLLVLSVVLAL